MVNHQDLYDPYIKEAVKHELESIPVPNMEDVWLNIEESLTKKQKKNNTLLYKRLAIGLAALMALSIGIGNESGFAYYKRAYNYLAEVLENTVAMQIDIRKEGKNQDKIYVYSLSLEEVINRSDFEIKTPELLPEGYSLTGVQLEELNKNTLRVELKYSDTVGEVISIVQELIKGDAEKPTDTISEELLKGKVDYTVYRLSDKDFVIYWEMANIRFTAKGKDKEKLIDVIESIN